LSAAARICSPFRRAVPEHDPRLRHGARDPAPGTGQHHRHGSSIIDPEIGRLGDIDTANVTMLAANGAIVTILNSRRCATGFDQRIEAFGVDRHGHFRQSAPIRPQTLLAGPCRHV
jgi:hypothetical protein